MLLQILVAGCAIPTIPLEGRPCPCADGWICEPTTALCVRPWARDGGRYPMDAGPPPPDWCMFARPDALFCQDFVAPVAGHERLLFGPETGISVTQAFGFETRGALEAHLGSSPGGAIFMMPLEPVGLSTEVFIKAHVFIPATAVVESDVGLFGIHGATAKDQQAVVAALLIDDSLAAGAFTPDLTSANDGSRPFPRGRWVCVEMRAFVHDTEGELELFIDGESYALQTGADTYPGEDFTQVSAGIFHDSMPPPFEVRLDRLVVDGQRVGCD